MTVTSRERAVAWVFGAAFAGSFVAGLVLGDPWRTVITWVYLGVSVASACGAFCYAVGTGKARKRADAALARASAVDARTRPDSSAAEVRRSDQAGGAR
ncbi:MULTISPECIES: hypothetical protein [Actinomycetes]|uniref:hypothetical protein n=1 Tax=Actinomycetes TaxID=1760 RepID=UPI00131A0AA7|nr:MULTISPECIES: hypothetical protein [Actinomycetes]